MAFAKSGTEVFDLVLNGIKIDTAAEIKFLGLRLDRNLNFNNQINHVRKTCFDRLNIIRVISSSRWHLTQKTRLEIYHALVRSIMEYASFIYKLLSTPSKARIDAIHHSALRIIYNKDRFFGTTQLLNLAGDSSMETRLSFLRDRYLNRAYENNNPLITRLILEYQRFAGGRRLMQETILCHAKIARPTSTVTTDPLDLSLSLDPVIGQDYPSP